MKITGLIILISFMALSDVRADNFSTRWTSTDEAWKRGYVFGISDMLRGTAAGTDPKAIAFAKGYQACLAGTTDVALVRIVDMYWQRNPTAASESPHSAVIKALYEMCSPHLPK
jgi:hypothetical protein